MLVLLVYVHSSPYSNYCYPAGNHKSHSKIFQSLIITKINFVHKFPRLECVKTNFRRPLLGNTQSSVRGCIESVSKLYGQRFYLIALALFNESNLSSNCLSLLASKSLAFRNLFSKIKDKKKFSDIEKIPHKFSLYKFSLSSRCAYILLCNSLLFVNKCLHFHASSLFVIQKYRGVFLSPGCRVSLRNLWNVFLLNPRLYSNSRARRSVRAISLHKFNHETIINYARGKKN
jgi:hypothetical protein